MSTVEDSLPTTGAGTEPEADAKEAAKARRLANLRPPFQKGQSGNPSGINGRGKPNEIAAFLDEPESTESNRTRFEAMIDSLYLSARRGDTLAAKTLIEYKVGKPRTTPNALDLAEHLRRVALNQAELALDILGPRLHSIDPEKYAEFMRACKGETSAFLLFAERFTNGEDSPESQPAEAETKVGEQNKQPEDEFAEPPAGSPAPGGEK